MTGDPGGGDPQGPDDRTPTELVFDDNRLLPHLTGEHEQHLSRIEKRLGISIITRGNRMILAGPRVQREQGKAVLLALWERLKAGMTVTAADVDAALRIADSDDAVLRSQALASLSNPQGALRTKRGAIAPRSPTQAAYLEALAKHELVFGLGPAGTGKTYLAVAQAVSLLVGRQIERIVLSRPAVEAGERLGFLPGDLKEKIDPYLRPLYDALHDMLPADQVQKRLENGAIEIAPLAFMRGRTLSNAFVILDEAQNTTPMQMKMFLTRMGEGSRMAVTGDITQIDLPAGQRSGLRDALEILAGVEGVAFVRFTEKDVVRHPLVARIVGAYDAADRRRAGPPSPPQPETST